MLLIIKIKCKLFSQEILDNFDFLVLNLTEKRGRRKKLSFLQKFCPSFYTLLETRVKTCEMKFFCGADILEYYSLLIIPNNNS